MSFLDLLLWVRWKDFTITGVCESDLHRFTCQPASCLTGEEVRRLKGRVDVLEAITRSASVSHLTSSGNKISERVESTYIEKNAASTLIDSDNGLNLDGAGKGGGTGNSLVQDRATLERLIQQLVRDELRSGSVRGVKM